MLKVVIIDYGEMFTNLIAAALDANCEIVGVLRKDTIKYSSFLKKIKDIFNPSQEYSYIKSYNLPEIDAKSVNSPEFRKKLIKLNCNVRCCLYGWINRKGLDKEKVVYMQPYI